jgi:hypothetical protein
MKFLTLISLILLISLPVFAQPTLDWVEYYEGHSLVYWPSTEIIMGTDEEILLTGWEGFNPYVSWVDLSGSVLDTVQVGIWNIVALENGEFAGFGEFSDDVIHFSRDHSVDWRVPIPYQDFSYGDISVFDRSNILVSLTNNIEPNREINILDISNTGNIEMTLVPLMDGSNRVDNAWKLPFGQYLVQGFQITHSGFLAGVEPSGNVLWTNYIEDSDDYNVSYRFQTYEFPDGRFFSRLSNHPNHPHCVWFDKNGVWVDSLTLNEESGLFTTLNDGGLLFGGPDRHDANGDFVYQIDLLPLEDEIDSHYALQHFSANFVHYKLQGFYCYGWIEYQVVDNFYYDTYLAYFSGDPVPTRVHARKQNPNQTATPGGSFRWSGRVVILDDTPQTVDIWTVARDPNWDVIGPVRLWEDITIQPGQVLEGGLIQSVPENAPLGDYNYILRVGDYPEHHYEAYFPFEVEAAGQRSVRDTRLDVTSRATSEWTLTVESWERGPASPDPTEAISSDW